MVGGWLEMVRKENLRFCSAFEETKPRLPVNTYVKKRKDLSANGKEVNGAHVGGTSRNIFGLRICG